MEEKARADHISITNSNELNYDDYSNSYKNQPELDDELFNENQTFHYLQSLDILPLD